MSALIRINQEGQFSEVTEGDAVAHALPVGDVASHDQPATDSSPSGD